MTSENKSDEILIGKVLDNIDKIDEITLDKIKEDSSKEKKLKDNTFNEIWSSDGTTNNVVKLRLVTLMMVAVVLALVASSYKYLNINTFHESNCEKVEKIINSLPSGANTSEQKASYIANCPYNLESQKEAGAFMQSVVSAVIGIIAGMSVGNQKH
jgi:hypothetical protein